MGVITVDGGGPEDDMATHDQRSRLILKIGWHLTMISHCFGPIYLGTREMPSHDENEEVEPRPILSIHISIDMYVLGLPASACSPG